MICDVFIKNLQDSRRERESSRRRDHEGDADRPRSHREDRRQSDHSNDRAHRRKQRDRKRDGTVNLEVERWHPHQEPTPEPEDTRNSGLPAHTLQSSREKGAAVERESVEQKPSNSPVAATVAEMEARLASRVWCHSKAEPALIVKISGSIWRSFGPDSAVLWTEAMPISLWSGAHAVHVNSPFGNYLFQVDFNLTLYFFIISFCLCVFLNLRDVDLPLPDFEHNSDLGGLYCPWSLNVRRQSN